MPYFSIIIPTYNSSETLRECLGSVLSQTFSDFEVLIMDAISSDQTVDIAEAYNDKRITVQSEKDSGVYDAMNKAIDKSTGKWLYFLGSDDKLYDEKVLENIASFTKNDEYDVVYGNAYFIGRKYFHDGEFTRQKLNNELNICHQAIFYRKDVFTRLGKYNLEFPINADWDFNLRCFATPDFKIKYIDLPIVNYNDMSGLSDSGINDLNFHAISGARKSKKIKELEIQADELVLHIRNLEKSKNYQIGRVILAPLRLTRTFIKKIFK